MARGVQQQLDTTNAAAANSGNQANQVFGADWGAIQNQLNPSTKTTEALTQLPMDAANSALAGAQQSAQQRVAKTNNSAGYTALADKFGRDKAQADSQAALQGQVAVQNLQNQGVKNAGQLFGTSDDTMAKLYDTSGKLAPQANPFLTNFSGALGKGIGGGLASNIGFGS